MNLKHFYTWGIAALIFVSCKVDFSPNADWQEIPVVYCVLDQDDSITVCRVQKAYLGEGDQYQYGAVYDSIQYPEGSIEVRLLGWPARRLSHGLLERDPHTTEPRQVIELEYNLLDTKPDGSFAHPLQPVYQAETRGLLDTSLVYQLVVIHSATGDTLCSAESCLIGNCAQMQNMLVKPNNVDKFNFSGAGGNKVCVMQWYALPRARQYQPYVNFAYHEFYRHYDAERDHWDTVKTPHIVRINVATKKSDLSSGSLETRLAQQSFLAAVKDSVTAYQRRHSIDPFAYLDDPWTDYSLVAEAEVDICLPCCTEELASYLFAHQPSNGINQEPISYTNINGGLGIFAARRTHLTYSVPANMANSGGYMKGLKDLGVGF